MNLKERYKLNKCAKVGELLICPSCNTQFKKAHYQQVFCRTKRGTICKDKYWNIVTPQKHCNTTRISPANLAWMENNKENDYDTFHPFEGLNDEDYKNH